MTSEIASDRRAVLLIGGGGFLGTNLTAALISSGRSVINFSRSHLHLLESDAVQYISTISDNIEDLVSQSCCVFHMAHGSSPATELDAMERNLSASMELTFTLMRACAKHNVRLIFLSSGGAIYGLNAPVPTPEDAPTYPISPYGVEKLVAERYLHIAALHFGLDYRVLRISNPYGPWQLGLRGQGVIGTWMRQVLDGKEIEMWGDGSVARDYVYVGDVCDAMIKTIYYSGPERTFNIGSGESQSLNQLFEKLRSICGDALRASYRDAGPAHVPVSILDTRLANRELGWQANIPLTEGLAQSWDWIHFHYARI